MYVSVASDVLGGNLRHFAYIVRYAWRCDQPNLYALVIWVARARHDLIWNDKECKMSVTALLVQSFLFLLYSSYRLSASLFALRALLRCIH